MYQIPQVYVLQKTIIFLQIAYCPIRTPLEKYYLIKPNKPFFQDALSKWNLLLWLIKISRGRFVEYHSIHSTLTWNATPLYPSIINLQLVACIHLKELVLGCHIINDSYMSSRTCWHIIGATYHRFSHQVYPYILTKAPSQSIHWACLPLTRTKL